MRRSIWFSGADVSSPPPAGSPINPESPQAQGLYMHFPLWDSSGPTVPWAYRDSISGLEAFSQCGSTKTIASAQDPVTGYWFPSFPGTGAGNSANFLGVGMPQALPSQFVFNSANASIGNPNQISVGAWFKPSANTNQVHLVGKTIPGQDVNPYYHFVVRIYANGSVDFVVTTGGANTYVVASSATGIITTGQWHCAYGTFDGNTARLYVDGKLRGTAVASSPGPVVNSSSSTFTMGGNPQQQFASQTLTGLLADVRVYSHAIGDSLIEQIWNDRWGLWTEPQRPALQPGAEVDVDATSTINLSVRASSGGRASSTMGFSVTASAARVYPVSAESTIGLSIQTHTQSVPVSASSTLNLSSSSNKIQTWTKSAASTIGLSATSSGRNTIIRVSAFTIIGLSNAESGGSEFVESIGSTFNLASTAIGRGTTITVSALNSINLRSLSAAVGVDWHAFASSDLLISASSVGGKAYRAGATSTLNLSSIVSANSTTRSTFGLSVSANAFREVGPASSTLSLAVSASASVELPDTGGSINRAFYTGLSTEFPVHFAETPSGLLLIADGIDPVLRWDGSSRSFYPAGILAPTTAPTIGASGIGSLSGTYTAYVRFLDADGNVSNLSPISDPVTAVSDAQIDYTNVPVSSEGRVTTRQILRNTSGQASTYYVDVETTDLVGTSFTSTRSDTELAAQEAVALIDTDNNVIANLYAPPPNYKSVPASHLNRMFLAVDVEYKTGNIQVTLGSTTVRGIGTSWPESMVGRSLFVVGSQHTYSIESVDVVNQTLTLSSAYSDVTDLFAVYAIRPPLSERKLIYYSESGLPEAWPPTNTISLQEDGDDITGLFVRGSFLYLVEKRHTYRFTFQEDPATDGFVFLSVARGSVNQRCIVNIEDATYMLDEWGVHRFTGGEESESISTPIQTLFRPGYSDISINWSADTRLWHAAHAPTHDTIRWFVSLSGSREPRHAICFNYRQSRWWIEEYTCKMTASSVASIGYRRSIVGSDARRILAIDTGTLDGVQQDVGTLGGTVTSSGALSVKIDGASWISPGIVNAPVWISKGKGIGQGRRITKVDGSTLYIDRPWQIAPDATSFIQVGGISWEWKSGWFRYSEDEASNNRSVDVGFEPMTVDSYANLQLFIDYSPRPKVWSYSRSNDGVVTTKGSPNIGISMSQDQGYVVFRYDGHSEQYSRGDSVVSLRLSGVQGVDQSRVYYVRINGAQ